jgi:hypothetical protein
MFATEEGVYGMEKSIQIQWTSENPLPSNDRASFLLAFTAPEYDKTKQQNLIWTISATSRKK